MNPTFDSAKAEAERKRVQGSIFYIREVPALQFISKKLCILVTEINTDSPLKNFLEVSEQPNITLMDVYSHFTSERPNSIIRLIWRNTEFSRQNGKMCLVRNYFNSLETTASSRELKGYKSYSNGKGYNLGWNKEENKLHTSAVERLAVDYDRNIVQHKVDSFQKRCNGLAVKFSLPVENLQLSASTTKVLKAEYIRFVGDLVQFTEQTLKDAEISDACISEIKDALAALDLGLKIPEPVCASLANDPTIETKSVNELELSVRSANVLQNAGISTIGELIRLSEPDLLKMQNTGRKSVNEIKDVLEELGLQLRDLGGVSP
jgi:hypothetical protein